MAVLTKLLTAGAVTAAVVTLAGAAQAATFANFSQAGTGDNIAWTKTGPTTGTLSSGPVAVKFNFLQSQLMQNSPTSSLSATLTMSASGSGSAFGSGGSPGDSLDQPNVGGSFTFTYNGPGYTDGLGNSHSAGDILLSGVFTLADITSNVGSSSASVLDSTAAGGSITYASQWMSFASSVQRDFAFNITSAHPLINAPAGEALNSFNGSSGGSFSTTGAVPEPATWAIMIAGFGMLGLAARRRRATGLAAV